MKRIVFAIAGTIAGLVALLSFKSHPPVSSATGLPSAALPGTGTSQAAGTPSATGSASSAPAGSGQSPSSSAAAPKSSAAATAAQYTGQAVDTQYGTVQVKVSVRQRKITDVSFVQLTSYDGRSQQINQEAAPILLQQTLSAQSAQIDGVSGATYTSQGYVQSLQSALDQAGI